MTEENSGTIALKWKDKRDVYALSTTHGPEMKPVPRRASRGRGRENDENIRQKPEMITEYNKLKGGIDIADTLQAYHSPERKSIHWYHKIADSLLYGTCIANAFLLWNLTKSGDEKLMHLNRFRELIVQDLLGLEPGPERTAKLTSHYLTKSDGSEGASGRSPRGRCRGCYSELAKSLSPSEARKRAKRVPTMCATCEDHPDFCLSCFQKAHKKLE